MIVSCQGWKLPDLMFATKRSLSDACTSIGNQMGKLYGTIDDAHHRSTRSALFFSSPYRSVIVLPPFNRSAIVLPPSTVRPSCSCLSTVRSSCSPLSAVRPLSATDGSPSTISTDQPSPSNSGGSVQWLEATKLQGLPSLIDEVMRTYRDGHLALTDGACMPSLTNKVMGTYRDGHLALTDGACMSSLTDEWLEAYSPSRLNNMNVKVEEWVRTDPYEGLDKSETHNFGRFNSADGLKEQLHMSCYNKATKDNRRCGGRWSTADRRRRRTGRKEVTMTVERSDRTGAAGGDDVGRRWRTAVDSSGQMRDNRKQRHRTSANSSGSIGGQPTTEILGAASGHGSRSPADNQDHQKRIRQPALIPC
ncbi:hypothetical protein LR48_Vigan08g024800 [Vigna angularis]|uniref:DUF1664 domain-containing protein n=1 Tax=Phaseolus angularis TaxID=3914 RepID=A0A0L9V378_PHAAN|nr:hypothetical protein LR48_Vigan08g024800 [Vigna angularis]